MANAAEIAGERPGRRWLPETVPGPIGAAMLVMEAAGGRADLVLARNEVMREALGGRTWLGALANVSGEFRDDVTVRIRFHDRDGRAAGSPVIAHAARLAPGAALHLQARLPAAAVGLQVCSLCWTAGGEIVALGPFRRGVFGSV